MGLIDIIIICCFLPAIFIGFKRGLVGQIVAVAVIYFGISLSARFSDALTGWMSNRWEIETTFALNAISFLLIFAAVAFILHLLGKIVEKVLKITLMGWLNRLLGVIASLFVCSLIVSVLICIFDGINNVTDLVSQKELSDSVMYPRLLKYAHTIFPRLISLFQN